MRYLYIDNFRGFSDTLIPFGDVNFFVGENSSGKTTVLGLLKILSSPIFWFNFEFWHDQIDFGNFAEMISLGTSDKKIFHLGLINEENNIIEVSLFTFVDKNGMPEVSRYLRLDENMKLKFRINKKIIEYKLVGKRTNSYTNEKVSDILKRMLEEINDNDTGYKRFKRQKLPIALEIMMIQEDLYKIKTSQDKRQLINNLPKIIPDRFKDLVWVAPIRSKPHKTYDKFGIKFSPEGEHTPYLIRNLLDNYSESNFLKYLNNFGKESGLFDTIVLKKYDKSKMSPFSLETVINKNRIQINNVGYGVSQSLPIIIEMYDRSKKTNFAIQQPEVHLHPKAQAAIGDIIFELAGKDDKIFYIETHSDYLIDRFRLNYKSSKAKPDSQIVFFSNSKSGNKVSLIKIGDNGDLPLNQPKEYRDFFIKEEIRILEL